EPWAGEPVSHVLARSGRSAAAAFTAVEWAMATTRTTRTARTGPGRGDTSLIEKLRKICMAMPEAHEKLSHGEPTWFAGKGKVFAMLDNHHHGAKHLSVCLPQPLGVQEALIESDPERFFRPPYVGPFGWVAIVLDTRPDWGMVERMVRDAYLH